MYRRESKNDEIVGRGGVFDEGAVLGLLGEGVIAVEPLKTSKGLILLRFLLHSLAFDINSLDWRFVHGRCFVRFRPCGPS